VGGKERVGFLSHLALAAKLCNHLTIKPRRPTIKDSTQYLRSEGAKRKSQLVAARAARKAAAKKAKMEAEKVNQAAAQPSEGRI